MILPEDLPVSIREAGSTLTRIYPNKHPFPIHFDRNDGGRFNAPAGEFGVCYLAESVEASFLETLVRGNALRLVTRSDLANRSCATVVLNRQLRLLQLHSEGLVTLALSAAEPHEANYRECQRLSADLWANHPDFDGIEYRSRWNDRLFCVALFERSGASLEWIRPATRLSELDSIRSILRHYDIGVI